MPTRLGRYELLGQLATGGMAEIHLARLAGEAGFEKIVVVKRLLPELVASKAFVAMFLDEGKLVARISHPNVCEVHELGREGADYFLVMPFLDGVAAGDFIARPRDPDRIAQLRVAAGIVAQACAGLHHAHELAGADGQPLGLVHRDVSPSNIFVTTAGVVKVLDFGIAKVRGAAETEAGTIKGKTQYMAPEQLLGEALDRRCDVFALGIVLFELATHQRLFKRASDYLAARAVLEEPIPRADAVDPAVPAALADVIAKALERSPAARYATARDLARGIEAALAPHGGVATPDQIGAALADWHGEELSAMRTRQAQVIGGARERTQATTASLRPGAREAAIEATGAATAVASRTSGDNRAATPVPDDASSETLVPRASRRALVPLLVGGLALATVAIAIVIATRPREPAERAPATVTRPPQATIDAAAPVQIAEAHDAVDAAVEVEPPKPAAETPRRRPNATSERPRNPTQPAREPGLVSIESTPFATIYVDGKQLGITPLVRKSVPAGTRRIKAVLQDGRSKTFEIDVPSGQLAKPIVLTW